MMDGFCFACACYCPRENLCTCQESNPCPECEVTCAGDTSDEME